MVLNSYCSATVLLEVLGGGVFRLLMMFGGVFAGGMGDISLGVLDYCFLVSFRCMERGNGWMTFFLIPPFFSLLRI